MAKVHILGQGGRIGSDLAEVAAERGHEIVKTDHAADTVAICLPSHVELGERLMDLVMGGKRVIDLSGRSKRFGYGQYALLGADGQPWEEDFKRDATVFSNPGCMAGATIRGLRDSGLEPYVQGAVDVVCVGGKSYAPREQQGGIWMANRLNDEHPHSKEIEAAFGSNITVNRLTPVVSDAARAGLLTVVTGTLSGDTPFDLLNRSSNEPLDTAAVEGTDRMLLRTQMHAGEDGIDFTLGVAIDNLRFVTANAVGLIEYLEG